VVKEVIKNSFFYAEYFPVTEILFTFALRKSDLLFESEGFSTRQDAFINTFELDIIG